MANEHLRQLPSVDRLIGEAEAVILVQDYGRDLTLTAIRQSLDEIRDQLRKGNGQPHHEPVLERASHLLEEWTTPTLRRVINATGVIIHTNLGRAPLSETALEAIREVAAGYSTLEYDLEKGERGSRSQHVESLIERITGAEAALVVNNNAAAVLLALAALAGPNKDFPEGRKALISRGQLIEIGGGFRIPEVMEQSGAQLVEVGTTNRTHRKDYEEAIDDDTALILRAHRSNFAMVGFTTEPSIKELVEIAHSKKLLVLDDVGSGALLDTSEYGLAPEPTVQASLQAGVDVVMFSGDKLLGGPQAGILAGSRAAIDQLRSHPLARAVRADKLCLAGLSATLIHYLKGDAITALPIWQMISRQPGQIKQKAQRWLRILHRSGLKCDIAEGRSAVGGGSLPGETLPTWLLMIQHESPDKAATTLRKNNPPIIVRIENDCLVIDPRTVLKRDKQALLAALKSLAD